MKISRRPAFALEAALLAGLFMGCSTTAPYFPSQRAILAQSVTARWSASSRLQANFLVEKYGPPDAIATNALGWSRKGPWKRIVVWDATSAYVAKQKTTDDLEQTIAYRVPQAKRKALAVFGSRVRASQDGTELYVRSSSEDINDLALNLADEVLRGVRDPVEARGLFERTLILATEGKSSRYVGKLLFSRED